MDTTDADSQPSRGSPAPDRTWGTLSLIGRDQELRLLHHEVGSSFTDGFGVTLVTGAAGLGKTALVMQVASEHGNVASVLSARAYRWGSTASFTMWIEALDRHLHGLAHRDQRRICGSFLASAAGFLSSIELPTDRWRAGPSREDMVDTVVGLFDRMSRLGPLLVVLDDMHLADDTSWEALRILSRRLAGSPIAVLAAARPAELQSRPIASEVLLGLEEDQALQRVPLSPLTRPEVTELAHAVLRDEVGDHPNFVGERLVTWLMDRTLGHPLFIVSLLRALLDESANLSAPRLERLPESLRDRVAMDLHALQPPERELVEVLAVMDQRTRLDELHAATGLAVDELAERLERLTRIRLVGEHGLGADLRYEVAHPIIQDAIYEGIGRARRQTLHRSVARALADGDRLGSSAAHFARAGITGDDEAVDTLYRAMDQAQARDLYQEALAILGALVDVLPRGDRRWLRLVEALRLDADWVLSHVAEGEAETAIRAMERAVEVVREFSDREAEAAVSLYLAAFLSLCAARFDQAEAACRRAIDLFEAANAREGAQLARNELAWIRGGAGDLSAHTEIADAVYEQATSVGHHAGAVQAAGTAAYALGLRGDFGRSRHLFHASMELARETGSSYRLAWGHAQHGLFLGLEGDLINGIASAETALESDPRAPDALAFEDLAHGLWLAGRLHEAVEMLERSAVRRPVHGSRRRAWGAALSARLLAEMGRPGQAARSLERALDTYAGGHTLTWSCWAGWSRGHLAWVEGAIDTATEALDAVVGRLREVGALAYEALVLADLAEVAFEDADVATCRTAAERLAQLSRATGAPLHRDLALLAAAWVAIRQGAVGEARDAAARATDGLDRAGYRMLAATARVARGQASEEVDRAGAVDLLQAAAATFEDCGAAWRRERVLSALRPLGSRGRRAVAEVQGPDSLTRREREVAKLAAAGHTAREIAERLFIGTRTVETHLGNVYGKLGVSSKRELVQRPHLLGPPSVDPWRSP